MNSPLVQNWDGRTGIINVRVVNKNNDWETTTWKVFLKRLVKTNRENAILLQYDYSNSQYPHLFCQLQSSFKEQLF